MSVDAVAQKAQAQLPDTLARLERYLTIPAISCDPDHFGDVRRLAGTIRDDLEALGLDNARVLELPDALPSVAAEWLHAEGAPTLVIYGHLDLQPVKGEPWTTPPHEAVRIGERMQARGSADDMGGWVSHIGAVRAWLEETGGLPLNVRLFIEGEEEIGSPNLERYMDAFPEAFAGDVMVLTDCENPSVDVPGLTVSLRGLMEVELVCEALTADGHSGLWGGVLPDVGIALCRLIARLTDEDTRMAVGRMDVPQSFRDGAVPWDPELVRRGGRLADGIAALPLRGRSEAEWAWRQPSITILSTTLPTPGHEKNALRTQASAKLSVRIAPGQTAEELLAAIESVVLADPPGGVRVTVNSAGGLASPWLYEPKGPAFPAADRAYQASWGNTPVHVGVGGSIPFVALFGERFSELPLLLNGVMDPETGAHGPNETLHLGVFEKAIQANVRLYAELASALG